MRENIELAELREVCTSGAGLTLNVEQSYEDNRSPMYQRTT